MTEKNIYITAIEYAIQQGQKGINFNELKEYLDRLFPGYIDKFTESFLIWFFSYFYHSEANMKAHKYETGQVRITDLKYLIEAFEKFFPERVCLSYRAHMEYIDYIELKQAREASVKAHKDAKTAIIISIIALFLAVIFGSSG